MLMPDFGTVQMLYKDRLSEIERKRRRLVLVFEPVDAAADDRQDSLMRRVTRWLRHSPPVHLTRATPVHQHR